MKPWNLERLATIAALYVFAQLGLQGWRDVSWLWWSLFAVMALLLLQAMWPVRGA